MSTILSFRSIENKYDVYRRKDWIKKFLKFLRENATKVINFKKKNEVIDKGEAGIKWKCKNLLYL